MFWKRQKKHSMGDLCIVPRGDKFVIERYVLEYNGPFLPAKYRWDREEFIDEITTVHEYGSVEEALAVIDRLREYVAQEETRHAEARRRRREEDSRAVYVDY
jgi:hypothetical protein